MFSPNSEMPIDLKLLLLFFGSTFVAYTCADYFLNRSDKFMLHESYNVTWVCVFFLLRCQFFRTLSFPEMSCVHVCMKAISNLFLWFWYSTKFHAKNYVESQHGKISGGLRMKKRIHMVESIKKNWKKNKTILANSKITSNSLVWNNKF